MEQCAERREWKDFLGRAPLQGNLSALGAANAGKTILVTGAGGYIGSGLSEAMEEIGVRHLILLESSEQNLESIDHKLSTIPSPVRHTSILGDAGDPPLLDDVFCTYRPEIIYHTAAFKHLPLMESHPLAAVRNNALVTYALAQAAVRHGAEKLILISTDKAVNPTSIMGASKRIAEQVILALAKAPTLMTAVRLGNVLGSPGSVVPLFTTQIACGGPITVTNTDATRYFITREDSVKYIVRSAAHEVGPQLLIADMGTPHKILDLGHFLMRREGREVPIVFTGLRPGEKLSEQLHGDRESVRFCQDCGLSAVADRYVPTTEAQLHLATIEDIVRRRDVASLLREVLALVPEYRPSDRILDLASRKTPTFTGT
jgi:FlaA1/EpsC-like NDP-sugar epimerase